MLEVIEEQAEQGVDYMTIHAGRAARIRAAGAPPQSRRIVSRGGALFGAKWMNAQQEGKTSCTSSFDEICKSSRSMT